MFDLELVDIFSCIGVGIATAILMAYFYFLFMKYFFISRHNHNAFLKWFRVNLERSYSQTGYAFVTLVLVYSLGIMVQEMTDYMTDSDENKNPIIKSFQRLNVVEKEGELRMDVLVRNDEKLTLLGREIFNDTALLRKIHKVHSSYFFNSGEASSYWQINGEDVLAKRKKEFMGYINGIYYTAKNWAYMNMEPVREELQGVQQRIDFARSIFILAVGSLVLLFAFYIMYVIKELTRGKKMFTVIENDKFQKMFFYPRTSLPVLLLIMWGGGQCYTAAENNYNERVFGYYVSHFKIDTDGDKGNKTVYIVADKQNIPVTDTKIPD